MLELLEHLNDMAIEFCELHDVTCCFRKDYKHSPYQCKHNSDPLIVCYRENKFSCPDIEQVEKYIAYVAAHEIDFLIDKFFATSHEARVMKGHISILLQLCKKEFSDNVYVKERILASMESTNILQEEDVENISLKEEECEEEIEKDIFQPKLGEELDLPASPPTNDSSTQTQKSFVIYENPCYYDETNNAPLLFNNATNELIDDNEECCLNMLYDNALDDGPMLIDNPQCLEVVTNLCEDKNDILSVCNGTLTHESPTLFLNSPCYTMKEKFAYVEKYLCGLQLSLVPNICCNHDIKLDIDLNNYFERGKHANEFHNKFNDPLYVPNYLS